MAVFTVCLPLYFERTNNDIDLKLIPDLKDADFNKFVEEKDIANVFKEEFGDNYGTITDMTYDKETKRLVFKLTITDSTPFIPYSGTNVDMIEKIIDAFEENVLEDSLYEGVSASYTIHDAFEYNKDEITFVTYSYLKNTEYKDVFTYVEIGVIDYRFAGMTVSC